MLVAALAVYALWCWRTRTTKAVQAEAARRMFPFLFWGSCIAFGLVHLGNFATAGLGLLSVLIVMPQFLVGIVMAYIRMRFGLLSAMGFHGAYNGVLVGISLMAAGVIVAF